MCEYSIISQGNTVAASDTELVMYSEFHVVFQTRELYIYVCAESKQAHSINANPPDMYSSMHVTKISSIHPLSGAYLICGTSSRTGHKLGSVGKKGIKIIGNMKYMLSLFAHKTVF